MQPNPLIKPYTQATAELMQGLLAETPGRFAIPLERLTFHRSEVPDPAKPESALAFYRDGRRTSDELIPIPYHRLELSRYVGLYPIHERYIPAHLVDDVDGTVEAVNAVLQWVVDHLGVRLDLIDIEFLMVPDPEDFQTRVVTIIPATTHPVWYGQLTLWVVAASDLRHNVIRRNYLALDVTAL